MLGGGLGGEGGVDGVDGGDGRGYIPPATPSNSSSLNSAASCNSSAVNSQPCSAPRAISDSASIPSPICACSSPLSATRNYRQLVVSILVLMVLFVVNLAKGLNGPLITLSL